MKGNFGKFTQPAKTKKVERYERLINIVHRTLSISFLSLSKIKYEYKQIIKIFYLLLTLIRPLV